MIVYIYIYIYIYTPCIVAGWCNHTNMMLRGVISHYFANGLTLPTSQGDKCVLQSLF